VSMNSVGLVDLINDAAGDPHIYRELDASARALLDADASSPEGDPAPLLRLYAQRLFEDEDYFSAPAREYSDELYLAVSCLDYPQLFDLNDSPAVRALQLTEAEHALAPSTFSPFDTEEWIAQNQNTEAYTACLDWPAPTIAQPPVQTSPPLIAPSLHLPVLVLGGELDTWTPAAGVPKVLEQVGGHHRYIEVANSTHVVGEGDTECGGTLVQEFVADPQAIDTMDDSCAANVPPIHAVGIYAAKLSEETPLEASEAAPMAELQLAAAAVTTAGDAIARYAAVEVELDHGLNGGTVAASHGGALLTLHDDRLIGEVPVSGTVKLTPAADPVDGQTAFATLTAKAPGVHRVSVTATWTTAGADARVQLLGSAGHQALAGSMPAP